MIAIIMVVKGNLFFSLLVVWFLKWAPFRPLVGMGALSSAFQFVFFPFFSISIFLCIRSHAGAYLFLTVPKGIHQLLRRAWISSFLLIFERPSIPTFLACP